MEANLDVGIVARSHIDPRLRGRVLVLGLGATRPVGFVAAVDVAAAHVSVDDHVLGPFCSGRVDDGIAEGVGRRLPTACST